MSRRIEHSCSVSAKQMHEFRNSFTNFEIQLHQPDSHGFAWRPVLLRDGITKLSSTIQHVSFLASALAVRCARPITNYESRCYALPIGITLLLGFNGIVSRCVGTEFAGWTRPAISTRKRIISAARPLASSANLPRRGHVRGSDRGRRGIACLTLFYGRPGRTLRRL